MTDIRATIATLKLLHEKATKAPWEEAARGNLWSPADGCDVLFAEDDDVFMNIDDTALVVMTRNALPDLLAYIAKLEVQVAHLEIELQHAKETL